MLFSSNRGNFLNLMADNAVLLDKILFQITSKFYDQRTTILPLSFNHESVWLLVHSFVFSTQTPPTRYNPLYQESINNQYYLSTFVLHKRQLGHLGCVLETYQRHLRGKGKASSGSREAAWGLLYWNSLSGFLHPTITPKIPSGWWNWKTEPICILHKS